MEKMLIKIIDKRNDLELVSKAFSNTRFLSVEKGKIFVEGDFIPRQEIQMTFIMIDIDNDKQRDSLISILVQIITEMHVNIQSIPDADGNIEGDYTLRDKRDEMSVVNLAINTMLYNEEQRSLLDLIALIVFNINANHLYNNGNKRTSLASADAILRYFGLYLAYSYDKAQMLKHWDKIMCDIANYKSIDSLKTEVKTMNYIKKMIMESIQIRCFKK